MTQEDSVRRLAEIRAGREAGQSWFSSLDVALLVDTIDSLTAERDRDRETARHVADSFKAEIRLLDAELEAVEADRERLRGALRHAHETMEQAGISTCIECDHTGRCTLPCAGGHARAALAGLTPTGAALATPPSEGGQS